MSFDINTARKAITDGQVQIQKGEGITHAIMRTIDPNNANKGVKDLEKAFRTLDTTSKNAIMELAIQVGKNAPFKGRPLSTKGYNITDITRIGEKLSLSDTTQSTPAPTAKPTPAAPAAKPTPAAPTAKPTPTAPTAKPAAAPAAAPEVNKMDLEKWRTLLGAGIIWGGTGTEKTPTVVGATTTVKAYMNLKMNNTEKSYTVVNDILYETSNNAWTRSTNLEIRNGKIEKVVPAPAAKPAAPSSKAPATSA